MTKWRKRFIGEEDMEDRETYGAGLWCQRCHEEVDRRRLYGVGERGGVLCAACVDEVWDELSDGEKLERLGYEVEE